MSDENNSRPPIVATVTRTPAYVQQRILDAFWETGRELLEGELKVSLDQLLYGAVAFCWHLGRKQLRWDIQRLVNYADHAWDTLERTQTVADIIRKPLG